MPEQLTQEQIDIVKATAPVLREHGVTITTHFYKRMLGLNPDLNNIFNVANQQTGLQPKALAHAVLAYAENIDNLPVLSAAVAKIAHKHASLDVTAEQYPIVGENLLAAIKEVLGDAATQDIISAWAAAYGVLADVFINVERDLKDAAAKAPGGWAGWKKFRLARKLKESDEVTSFCFEPLDNSEVPRYQPGQYLTLRVFDKNSGYLQPRQYSLSDSPGNKYLRISVKRESERPGNPAGLVSNLLHSNVEEGSEVELRPPFGEMFLSEGESPVVLISGGVGLTPMVSMLNSIVESGNGRRVVYIHACRNGEVHAMKEHINETVAENDNVSKIVYYDTVSSSDTKGKDYDHVGVLDIGAIKNNVVLPGADYYVCGPRPFMVAQRQSLVDLGVAPEKIHIEVFGTGSEYD
jgi:hemoglobin-like flavoprotein/ferredoxin-NADP reductase